MGYPVKKYFNPSSIYTLSILFKGLKELGVSGGVGPEITF